MVIFLRLGAVLNVGRPGGTGEAFMALQHYGDAAASFWEGLMLDSGNKEMKNKFDHALATGKAAAKAEKTSAEGKKSAAVLTPGGGSVQGQPSDIEVAKEAEIARLKMRLQVAKNAGQYAVADECRDELEKNHSINIANSSSEEENADNS